MVRNQVAILLPTQYQGGTLRLAKSLAKQLHNESRLRDGSLGVVFGNIDNSYSIAHDLNDLASLDIEIRNFRMQVLTRQEAKKKACLLPGPLLFTQDSYVVPNDPSDSGFLDCSLWIFISDRIFKTLLPLRKTAIFTADFIQRYVPQIFDSNQFSDQSSAANTFLRNGRNADYIFTSTPGTYGDAIGYLGRKDGVILLDPCFDADFLLRSENGQQTPHPIEQPYFLWVTNGTAHKNHFHAITALQHYYSHLNGELHCVITGVSTETFNPDRDLSSRGINDHPYHREIRHRIGSLLPWKEKLHFAGHVHDDEYSTLLRGSQFLWHNVLADNGTYSVVEAAYAGVPALSSNYPQQQYVNEYFGLNMSFFNPFAPEDAAASLRRMELAEPAVLLDQELIRRRTWQMLSPYVYNIIRNCVSRPRKHRRLYS